MISNGLKKEKLIFNMQNQLKEELNLNIDKLMNKRIIFNNYGKELRPINGWKVQTTSINNKIIKPSYEQATVTAIDSSCIYVGETDEGSIYAAQVSIAISNKGKPSNYLKFGPLIYYIDEYYASQLSYSISNSGRYSRILLNDKTTAQRIIREKLERITALELSKMLSGAIILVDGCLSSSIFRNINICTGNILENAERNKNLVIGISKSTRVRLLNPFLQVLYSTNKIPSYLDVSSFFYTSNINKKTILARFSDDGHPYRIDLSDSNIESSIGLLLSSDLFYRGYPETLRIAHHLSIFTTAHCYSIKGYLLKKANLVIVPSEDIRQITLGNIKF